MIAGLKRNRLKEVKRIVIKIGTTSLTYENGHVNLKRIRKLTEIICDLMNMDKEVILVSSGAIGIGVDKLQLPGRPQTVSGKQAVAAVGQLMLMNIYERFFSELSQNVAQILLTKDVTEGAETRQNVINTFNELLKMRVIPIVNENDSVSVDEIKFGDNDFLSYIVATITGSDLLIILTDIDGFYDKNPRDYNDAILMHNITDLSEKIEEAAGGSDSELGTGGMLTKVHASRLAAEKGVAAVICNGEDPAIIYDILDGKDVGTMFIPED
ncbi:MAG: glutamate 5-kinase [Clostridia bacterium]|nr:glutamate 5-kinase [Clostridia bacterium]